MKTATDWMTEGKSERQSHFRASLDCLTHVVGQLQDEPRPQGQTKVLSDAELLAMDAARLAGDTVESFVASVIVARAARPAVTQKPFSVRDVQRVMAKLAAAHPEHNIRPGDGRALRMPRRD